MRIKIFAVLGLFLLCGCISSPKRVEIDAKPLAPDDCVAIVIEIEDSTTVFRVVDSSGDISVPYVGNLHLAGMTVQQAKDRIYHELVPKYYSWMQVSVRRCR